MLNPDVNIVKYKVTPHTMLNPDARVVKHKVTPYTVPNPNVNIVDFQVTPLSLTSVGPCVQIIIGQKRNRI